MTYQAIADQLDADVDDANKRAAQMYLAAFRRMLAPFKITHKLSIDSDGPGYASLWIDYKGSGFIFYDRFNLSRTNARVFPVARALQEINNVIAENCKVFRHIFGEEI